MNTPIQFPVCVVSGGVPIAEYRDEQPFSYGADDEAIQHPATAWRFWTAADWSGLCPGWAILPLIDAPPAEPGKRAERLPVDDWMVGDDAVTATYRLVDLTPEEVAAQGAALKQQVAAAVQRHLDATVSPRNYTSAAAAVSYVGDPNPRWNAEGLAVRAWRSAVWTACFAALDAVLAGERPPLTPEEMVAELPPLVWPE